MDRAVLNQGDFILILSGKPTYEDLKQKVIKLRNETDELRKLQNEYRTNQVENFETTLEMEKAIERANQMAAEAEISNLEFSQIFNTVTDAIWVIDRKFKILRINRALSHLIGQKESEVIGKKCSDVLRGPICNYAKCPMKTVIKTRKSLELDVNIKTACGKDTPFMLTVTPFFGFEGKPIGILSIFKDITERKQIEQDLQAANKELKRLTVIDGLTQIANRRHFDNTISLEWKRLSREKEDLSLILCDVDYFKLYNDTYGHQMGDECLKDIAHCLKDAAKRPSDLAARYGGEEFAVILPNTDPEGATIVAEKIRQKIEKLKINHKTSTIHPYVTLSLGVASVKLPKKGASAADLLSLADNALYEAKGNGRNRCVTKGLVERK